MVFSICIRLYCVYVLLWFTQAEQHFLKHNDAGSWVQDSALMLCMSKEVPWYLVIPFIFDDAGILYDAGISL